MTTTVRIGDDAKANLFRLQEAWRAATGSQPSQQDLLAVALDYLRRHKEDFLRESTWKPLDEDRIRKIQQDLRFDDPDVSADQIDQTLYGTHRP